MEEQQTVKFHKAHAGLANTLYNKDKVFAAQKAEDQRIAQQQAEDQQKREYLAMLANSGQGLPTKQGLELPTASTIPLRSIG